MIRSKLYPHLRSASAALTYIYIYIYICKDIFIFIYVQGLINWYIVIRGQTFIKGHRFTHIRSYIC